MKGTYTAALLIAAAGLTSGCSMFGQDDTETDMVSESNSSVAAESSLESEDSSSQSSTSESESTSTSESQEDMSETNALTTEEVLAQVGQDLDTDLPVQLPENLPLDNNMYLTARTSEIDAGYQVIFYESTVQLPVNDTSLGDGETKAYPIAVVTVQDYASEDESLETLGYMNYDESGGYEEVDLGYGITGYQDSATGQTYISWNEGRWALSTASTTQDPQVGVDLAKEAVAFLEENVLPVPNEYGSIKLDTIHNEHSISWQEGSTVVTIDQIEDPLEALETAASIK